MSTPLRQHFMIDPTITFLNHGSFGACPKPVFASYQRWQAELEKQPVDFLGRRIAGLLDEARAAFGNYLGASGDDMAFVPNTMTGLNIIARSLRFAPGDEVLASDQEYGAADILWNFVAARTGMKYVRHPVRLTTHADFVDSLFEAVTPNTKAIFISHISAPTGLIFPVAEVCKRARALGIITIIDGAHAPAHVPVDLAAIDADYYAGNAHKWLMAPKGSAFFYARKDRQDALDPLLVSWGYVPENGFAARHRWNATADPAAYLAVPDAISFQAEHDWDSVRVESRIFALHIRERLLNILGTTPIVSNPKEWLGQLAGALLPEGVDARALWDKLYANHRVEIPIFLWNGKPVIRASAQCYNSEADIDRLEEALRAELKLA
jgi:isopenicillin-N epimerase